MNSDARMTLNELAAASSAVLAKAEAAYQAALDREARDLAAAVRDRSGMADGYWKPTHAARLKLHAAAVVHDALSELVSEVRPGR